MIKRLLVIAVLMPAAILFAQWQPMGPPGGDFRAMARSASSDNTIYLASNGSPSNIWRTTDNGTTWSRMGSISSSIYSLAVDPSNPAIMYAGGTYMYRSTNAGVSWTQLSMPTYHYYCYDIKIHPSAPTTIMSACYIYASNYYHMGFIKSTNSGTNWMSETLGVDTSYAYALAVDPSNRSNIYVGGYKYAASTYTPIVYKSTDGGSTFAPAGVLPGGQYYCYSLAVHETMSNYVYAGTLYGIYRSTDAGGTWASVWTGSYNYSLNTTPANVNLLYSGGYGYVYRSIDAGITWSTLSTGLSGGAFYGVSISKVNAANVVAANNADFFKSTNSGTNWSFAHDGLLAAPITTMGNAPSAPWSIYVDNNNVAQYHSLNNGATWTLMTKPIGCGSICNFGIAYDNPNYLLEFEGSG
jgi:photosystem II stability/assembly factor-like uncharacterized protein